MAEGEAVKPRVDTSSPRSCLQESRLSRHLFEVRGRESCPSLTRTAQDGRQSHAGQCGERDFRSIAHFDSIRTFGTGSNVGLLSSGSFSLRQRN
jgi:hypothetical protein